MQPDTDYIFEVIAHCKSGALVTGQCSTIRTMKKVSSPPGVPIMIKSTHNSVSLAWNEPIKNSQLVNKYIIYKHLNPSATGMYRAQTLSQCCETIDSKPEIIVHNLVQNTEYSFHVVADCKGTVSEPSPISKIMQTKKACSAPGKPLMINYTYSSISLKWSKPANQPDIIKHYIIRSCKGPNINYETTLTANYFKFENLSPNTTYIFQVIAHCGDDVDIASEESDPITTDKAICSAPYNPTVSDVTEYTAVVQWKIPEKYPELVKDYIVIYQSETDSGKVTVPPVANIQMQTAKIINLQPDSSYRIKICAVSLDINESENCDMYSTCKAGTLPDVCSEPGPPRCKGQPTHNRIILNWDEPKEHPHLVLHYSVKVYESDDSTPCKLETTKSKEPEIGLYHLNSNTKYKFKVFAVCKLGSSPESELSDEITTEKEKCSPPGVPGAYDRAHNSITLHWARPTQSAHLIHHYNVYYNKFDEDHQGKWEMVYTVEDSEKKKVEQLKPNAGYFFKVSAICKDGTESDCSKCSERISTREIKLVDKLEKSELKVLDIPNSAPLVCLSLDKLMHKSIENKDLKIAKYSFGHEPSITSNIEEKILLLIGPSGCGKSTMINGIINYIFGIEWTDEFRLKLIHDESSLSQAHSQTTWITSYTFYWQEGFPFPYTLTVVDTPGFGDTRGIKQDGQLIQQIKTFFEKKVEEGGLESVHGIGFLTKSSETRLTPAQKYIYNSMLGIFGDDVETNILIMATFHDGGEPQILDSLKEARIPYDDKLFYFNNGSLFQPPNKSIVGNSLWLMGVGSFAKFFTKLGITQDVSIQLSRSVIDDREKLKTIASGLSEQVCIGLSKYDKLKKIKNAIEDNKDVIQSCKDFETEIDVTDYKTHALPNDIYVTNCILCNRTCHENCAFRDNDEKKWCCAMNNRGDEATCNICPGKCSWRDHRNNGCKFVPYTRKEKVTNKVMEQQFNQALRSEQDMKSTIEKITSDMKSIYNDIIKTLHMANSCLEQLRQKALLKQHHLTDVKYIDLLVAKEEQEAEDGYLDRITYLKRIRGDIEAFTLTRRFNPDTMDDNQFFCEFRKWKDEVEGSGSDEEYKMYTLD